MRGEQAVEVGRRLPVHRDPRGAGGQVVVEQPVGIGDHQVDVERQPRVPRERRDHRRAEGQVGHEVAVHHVDVHEVGAAGFADARAPPARSAKSAARIDGASSIIGASGSLALAATTSEMTSRRRSGWPGSGELAQDRAVGDPFVRLELDVADAKAAALERARTGS